jgi:mannan endo-1,4-beta-mannosidase
VTADGGSLRVDGGPWRFAGTTTYYLHELSHDMIDSVLNDASPDNRRARPRRSP